MCAAAILWRGIPRLVYGTSIETTNAMDFPPRTFTPSDLHIEEIASRASVALPEITAGVLEAECNALYEEMVRRMEG
jgi:tRNA(Arg) A34 adenosine deaminase TadA